MLQWIKFTGHKILLYPWRKKKTERKREKQFWRFGLEETDQGTLNRRKRLKCTNNFFIFYFQNINVSSHSGDPKMYLIVCISRRQQSSLTRRQKRCNFGTSVQTKLETSVNRNFVSASNFSSPGNKRKNGNISLLSNVFFSY